jgi:hypothetical protein
MITLKFYRRIRHFVKTGLLFSSHSHNNTLKRFYSCLNRSNLIRVQCPGRTEPFFWVAHLSSSIASILVRVSSTLRVPSSPIWEEYK